MSESLDLEGLALEIFDEIDPDDYTSNNLEAIRKVLAEHLSNGDVAPKPQSSDVAPKPQSNVAELRGRDRIHHEDQPIANIQVRAIPYDGDVYIASKDIIALAQTLQTAGEGFQSLITHLLPYTMASQLIVGPESSDG